MCAWERVKQCSLLSQMYLRTHSFISLPVTVIILLQICRLACLPTLPLAPGDCASQWDVHLLFLTPWLQKLPCPTHLALLPLYLDVSRPAPPLLRLPNPGTTTWRALLAFCNGQLTVKKNNIMTTCLGEKSCFPQNQLSHINLFLAVGFSHVPWM